MEEQALYRAILAAPYDDAPRLVYADWLDENADSFTPVVARGERGRAEFIRLQCESARLAPEGWPVGPRPVAPELARRERRLIFQHGKKWRGAFPFRSSSAPFDRGFLRPYRALRPQQFLDWAPAPFEIFTHPFPPLPNDSPARRYIPEEAGPFAACPLWDVHLCASSWHNDPFADTGQYGPLLAEVAKSPALERVGWLKLSFFRSSVVEFLRTGNFANVETLVLNSGPFPEVLEAVTVNESFRSLRYVQFGNDRWAWAPSYGALMQYFVLAAQVSQANARHLPYGEMRGALRNILRDTPIVPTPAPTPAPLPNPFPFPTRPIAADNAPNESKGGALGLIWGALVILILIAKAVETKPGASTPTFPADQRFHIPEYKPFEYKIPDFKPYQFDPDLLKPKHDPELEALMKRYRKGEPLPPFFLPRQKVPVAPPPREVKRAGESGEESRPEK